MYNLMCNLAFVFSDIAYTLVVLCLTKKTHIPKTLHITLYVPDAYSLYFACTHTVRYSRRITSHFNLLYIMSDLTH